MTAEPGHDGHEGLLTDIGAFDVSGESVMVNGRWDGGGGASVHSRAAVALTGQGDGGFGTSTGSGTA